MDIEGLTLALEGRWYDGYSLCRCPAHDDKTPSLKVIEGDHGRALLHCYAGCDQAAVISALRARGLWADRGDRRLLDPEAVRRRERQRERDQAAASRIAQDMWRRAGPAEGTQTETYLRTRGLTGPFPPTIRHRPAARHRETGLILPCMVAAVAVWPSRAVTAVHRTFLTLDGNRKAPVSSPKRMLGPCKGGAVRLAAAGPVLGVAEGLETGLSVQQAIGLPVWCGLSAFGIEALVLPPLAAEVRIFADIDASGRGQRAAETAAERWHAEGRRVFIVLPPTPGDFNDLIRPATAKETAA